MNAAAIAGRIVRERPAFHSAQGEARVWNALPGTLDMISRLVKPGDRTLELGSGASTVVFLAAGALHTAVSPHGAEHQAIREYCAGIGVDTDRATFVEGFSDDVLPVLPETEELDAAFVDGAHSFPYPVVDWHYVSRRLRVGGTLMMDDVPIPAAELVFRHMRDDPAWELLEVVDDRAAAFRKLAVAPEGDNWRAQRFNRGYPDYSFLPGLHRVRASSRHVAAITRGRAAKMLRRDTSS
jgi:predicted O-methyltransferase YrrM